MGSGPPGGRAGSGAGRRRRPGLRVGWALSAPEAERQEFAGALAGWGLSAEQVDDTLAGTAFGLSLVVLRPAESGDPSPGVAIVVSDRQDPELRELFARRAEASQADFEAEWKVEGAPTVRVVLGPDEQALVRFGIGILAPRQLERRYLFAVQGFPVQLARMQVPGTGIWLAPAKAVEKAIAREGPQETYAVTDLCLPVGRSDRAVGSIDEALAHVGSPRESAVAPPMNRAERRAAARKKGG